MIDAEGRALGVTTENWLDPPYNRWGFRHVPDLVRTAPISRGSGPVRELPRAERDLDGFSFDHGGRTYTVAEMLAETSTDGFVVIHDGAVVTEQYFGGMQPTDTHLLMSCSKSLGSILCGVLAGRGLLAPTDLVTDHLPELSGTAWEGCRIQDILDMRVGIAWDFDVDEYTIIDVSDYRTHDRAGEIPTDTETWIRTVGRGPLRPRRRPVPLLLACVGRARLAPVAGRRGAVPGALLARDLVADRRRAGRRDHARPRRLRDRRGRHLHHAPRSRAVRAAVSRGRQDRRRAGGSRRLDHARLRPRCRPHRGVPRIGHGRPDAARRLLPRQVVGVRRAERRLHRPRHERAGDPRPPAFPDGDRQVLDLRRRARLGRLRRSTTRG